MENTEIVAKVSNAQTDDRLIDDVVNCVINALKAQKMDWKLQLSHYLITGEPIYITRNYSARNLIQQVDRFDLLSYILKEYANLKGH